MENEVVKQTVESGGLPLDDGLEPLPEWAAKEIRETWAAAQGKGQHESFRIIEIMVDRLGYGRLQNNPKGF